MTLTGFTSAAITVPTAERVFFIIFAACEQVANRRRPEAPAHAGGMAACMPFITFTMTSCSSSTSQGAWVPVGSHLEQGEDPTEESVVARLQ